MTATGQFARRTTAELTDPSTPRASNPRPELPTTIISASSDILISAGTGAEYTNSRLIVTLRSAGIESSAILAACMTALLPSSSSPTANDSGYGTGGQLTVGVTTAWTIVRETFLSAASRAAQHTAAFDAGEPSTATTMPRGFMGADISCSSRQERR